MTTGQSLKSLGITKKLKKGKKLKTKKKDQFKNECIYRPGHRDTNDDRDTGNINNERDAQRAITDWDTGTKMTTEISIYINTGNINDERDTGNLRLAITINKVQGQSLE